MAKTKLHPAEKFFAENWNDTKHRIHISAVIKACLGTARDTYLNPELFVIAGWIHDMGKLTDKKNHHIASIKFLDKFVKEHPKYLRNYEILKDCIINHRTDGNPKTVYGLVFKAADKVALRNKKWLDFKKAKRT